MNSKTQIDWNQLSNIVRRGVCVIDGVNKSFIIENDNLLIEDIEVAENVAISQPLANGLRQLVIFKGCIFKQSFSFSNFSNIDSLRFINCRFEKEVDISQLGKNLEIDNDCIFYQRCSIRFSDYKDLTISKSNFRDELNIGGQCHSIKLMDLNVNDDLEKASTKLVFQDASVRHSKFETIFFSAITLSNNSRFFFEGDFINIRCVEFSLNHVTIGHLIHFMKCRMDVFFIDNISPHEKTSSHRYLKLSTKCEIGKASIPLHMLDSTAIENCSFSELRLTGNNVNASIFKISDCDLDKFILTDVQNKGTISLRDISSKKRQIIGFINSDLGRMDFIKCNFSKGILEFQNSKIMETFLAETDFPKRVETNSVGNYSQAQLAFGQLQTAFQKQGDTVRNLEYHSREIEAHFNNIKLFSRDFFTKVNLGLNLISNYFGRWWWLGIVFTLVVGLFFFSLILGSTNGFIYSYRLTFTWEHIDSFLKFMNPLRHFETEAIFSNHKNIHVTKSSYVLDFAGRVFVAFGYYQTIQAFRRYGRK